MLVLLLKQFVYSLLSASYDQSKVARCLLEVGEQVEKKNFHVQ